jgi:hypothetical protein
LNAYTKVENQAGCCTPPAAASSLNLVSGSCCSEAPENAVHNGLAELLRKYDVNSFAASVQVYAFKP